MAKSTVWFGYLEAGRKGSLVVRDATLDTGTSSTIYLFNEKKGKILEYRRDIVEPKLRELSEGEAAGVDALREAFDAARSGFMPRIARRPVSLPPTRRKRHEAEEEPEVSPDDTSKDFDADDDEDDEIDPDSSLDENADDDDDDDNDDE